MAVQKRMEESPSRERDIAIAKKVIKTKPNCIYGLPAPTTRGYEAAMAVDSSFSIAVRSAAEKLGAIGELYSGGRFSEYYWYKKVRLSEYREEILLKRYGGHKWRGWARDDIQSEARRLLEEDAKTENEAKANRDGKSHKLHGIQEVES